MKTKPTLDNGIIDAIASPGTIPTTLIQNLVSNYRNFQLAAINSSLNINDAHSIWFSVATLKKFISDIESEAQNVNPGITENDLGIRFYYAAYPTLENWKQMEGQPIGQEYAGKHTLVMIPTLKMENGTGELLDRDFNPLNPATYSLADNSLQRMALSSEDASLSSEETIAQNHGQLIPPSDPNVETY